MIDTDKYEGHTEGPWDRDGDTIFKYHKEREKWVPVQCNKEKDKAWEADMLLIEDAPLFLQEVKRLRELVAKAQTMVDWLLSSLGGVLHDLKECEKE